MKVLQIIVTLDPRYGGPVNVCLEMSRELARLGAQVTIFTTKLGFPSGKRSDIQRGETCQAGIRICYFPVQFRPMAFSLQMAAALWRKIREYDIVHIHGLYRFPQTFAAWCARRQGVPYIITTHGTLDPFLFHHPRHLKLKRVYERLFALQNLNDAATIHFTTQEEQKLVSYLQLQAPGVVIPIGVDWHRFRDLPSPGRFRDYLGLKNNEQIILHLGRIHFKKGLDLLVKGFSIVADVLPNAKLVIAGPDNDGYGKEVRRWIAEKNLEDRLYFPGMIKGQQVLEAYIDADIFALASYTESFGIAVVEAMACACPVVISDKVNIWRDIQEANAGMVVQCKAKAVGSAILQLIEDPHRRHTMGLAGRDFVRINYNWEQIGHQVMDLYHNLTRSSIA